MTNDEVIEQLDLLARQDSNDIEIDGLRGVIAELKKRPESRGVMDALFNTLKRNHTYVLSFGDGSKVTGVFHEYMPDGTLKFAANGATMLINPSWLKIATLTRR